VKLARAAWPVLVGVLLGLAGGAVWTLFQSDSYRAEARVQVRGEASGLVPAVKALAESRLLEQNVAQTLRLAEEPEVTASGGNGGIVTLAAEAGTSERARQLDGEAAIVLGHLVVARFGNGAGVTVLDPAHTVEQTSPTPERNVLLAGLIGLVGGVAGAIALGRRRPAPVPVVPEVPVPDPDVERHLLERVDAVTKRERAMARRAGELAQREARVHEAEQELEATERAQELEATERAQELEAVKRAQELEAERLTRELDAARLVHEREAEKLAQEREAVKRAAAEPEPEPDPEPEPKPEPQPILERRPSLRSRWTLDDLEELVRKHRGSDPARDREWTTYLFFLREHAFVDGTLPASFDPLISEVFGSLLR
jgi:hypothetical protein